MSRERLTDIANPLSMGKSMPKSKKPDVEELLRERLRALGSKGGKAAAKKLSVDARKEKAQKAAQARWKKAEPQTESLKVHSDPILPKKKPAAKKK